MRFWKIQNGLKTQGNKDFEQIFREKRDMAQIGQTHKGPYMENDFWLQHDARRRSKIISKGRKKSMDTRSFEDCEGRSSFGVYLRCRILIDAVQH